MGWQRANQPMHHYQQVAPLQETSFCVLLVHTQTLGTGAFGAVKLVHDAKTKKLLAMKCLKRRNINKYLEAEIVNHSLLRHPHVVQFKEVFLTAEHVNIVMEYANGGSLFDLVRTQKRLKETQVCSLRCRNCSHTPAACCCFGSAQQEPESRRQGDTGGAWALPSTVATLQHTWHSSYNPAACGWL
jgi:hypothetical protein